MLPPFVSTSAVTTIPPLGGVFVKRDPDARSYADVTVWRDYEARLPAVFQLSGESPEEEWYKWRDIAVHVDRLPARDAPLKLMLLHGMGGYGRIVLGFGTAYRPELCEVVAPDLPGYGLTRAPVGRLIFSAWTSCVQDFIEAELRRDDRPIVLFGLSLGGMVAYHVACTAPVQGLMATAFVDMTDAEVAAGVSRFTRLSRLTLPLVKRAPRFLTGLRIPSRLLGKVHFISNDAELSRLVEKDPYGGGNSLPLSFLQSIMEIAPALAPKQFECCPVLLVHPGADRMTDIAFSRRFFDRLAAPKRMVVLDGAGHWPIEEPGATQMRESVKSFLEQVASDCS